MNKSTKEVTLMYLESIKKDKEIQFNNHRAIAARLNNEIIGIEKTIKIVKESEGE